MGKGGMMKFCDALCRRVTVITDTDILRVERKPGTHLYTLFKRVRAEVSQRGSAALDSSVLSKPVELACGSFEAVICCLPPRPACALMQHVSLALLFISSCLIAAPRFDDMFDSLQLQLLPAVVPRARAVTYKPRWVLLLEFPLILPVSIDVAYVKPVVSNCPIDYVCRESCRGSGNAQQRNGDSDVSALVPMKVSGGRDALNANLDRWVAHASCDWSACRTNLSPALAARELAEVFMKILGMQQ